MGERLNAAELARRMGVVPSRIAQLLADGRLEGTYTGEGRERRFDLERVAEALNMRLSIGHATGNGAKGIAARTAAAVGADAMAGVPEEARQRLAQATVMAQARIVRAKAERADLENSELRRKAAAHEGRWVLASEVEREARRAIAAEVAEFEAMFRLAARRIADECGADFGAVKRVLAQCWREHRARRAEVLTEEADEAGWTPAEIDEADAATIPAPRQT